MPHSADRLPSSFTVRTSARKRAGQRREGGPHVAGGWLTDWSALRLGLVIFGIALAVRLLYLWDVSDCPTFRIPIVDARAYDELARGWVQQGRFGKEFFWQPSCYPVFLGLIYLVTDCSVVAARLVQVVIGAATCALTYWLGERVFERRTALLAGVLTALCGPLLFLEAELVGAGLAAFWVVALQLLLRRAENGEGLAVYAVLGVCGALAILTRPTFVPFVAIGGLWLAWRLYRRALPWPRLGRIAASLGIGFVLIALPAAMEAWRLTGRLTLLPSSGGINFYIGNNPDSARLLMLRPGEEWDNLAQLPAREGITDMWAQQQFFYDRARAYVFDQPLAALGGLAHKALQYVSSREIPRNIDIYLYRRWSGLLRALVWKVGGFGFPLGVLLPLAVVGLVTAWKRLPTPLLLFLILDPLAIVLVFVASRYRISILPVVCLLAAAGIVAVGATVRARQWPRVGVMAAVSAAVVLLASWPGPFPQERQNFEAEMYFGAAYRQIAVRRPADALQYLPKALQLDPENANGHANLAALLVLSGRPAEAIEHYETALQLHSRAAEPNESQLATMHEDVAKLLAGQRQFDRALEHYRAAVALAPDKATIHAGLGLTLHALRQIPDAENVLRRALALDPRLAPAHVGLGRVLRDQGDLDAAAQQFQEALRLDPRSAEAQRGLESLRAGRSPP